MEDLQKSQNDKSCSLTMPEGLKNLMFDISREERLASEQTVHLMLSDPVVHGHTQHPKSCVCVTSLGNWIKQVLRAQPENIYQFIADYLSAMLVARDSLNVASHVCEYICEASAPLELDDELKDINLTEDEATKAHKIINEYLQDDEVAKENLSARLMKANIDRSKINSIKRAVETAFKRKVVEKIPPLDIQFNYNPEAKKATANTLKLYCMPMTQEEQSPTSGPKVPYGQDSEKVKSRKSSTDSSDDLFKNIQYDGGIQDLYVSGNSKPYQNSSLTSLAGSYGLAKYKDRAVGNVPEKEDHNISYEDEEERDDSHSHDKSTKRHIHLEVSASKNSLDDEVLINVHNEFNADGNDKAMGEEGDDNEEEILEEINTNISLDAKDESDLSVDEEFD